MKNVHMGEGSGRGSGRVGSDFLSAIAGRVESGQRFAGLGQVGSKKSDPWTTLITGELRPYLCFRAYGRICYVESTMQERVWR